MRMDVEKPNLPVFSYKFQGIFNSSVFTELTEHTESKLIILQVDRCKAYDYFCKFCIRLISRQRWLTSTKTFKWFCLDLFLRWRSRVKFHKLPHLTRDVTGQHYRPVPSDVSLPRLSERRRRLKFKLDLVADWAEKYFSAQSAGWNSTTSGTGSVRISSQGLFSSWSKLSPQNIASSRLAAPGSPRMIK